MIQFNMVSIAATPRVDGVGDGDGAVRRRKDGRSPRSANVGSAVIGNLPGEGVLPVAEALGNRKTFRQRPLEDAGSFPVGIGV